MIKFGMTVADMIAQLTRGFTKQTGRLPSGLEKIKIQQEAIQRFKDMNKVVDMKGNPINPAEGILGGEQAQNFSKKLDAALYEDRGGNIIPAQFDESPAFPSYTAKETEEQIRQRLLKNNKDGIASMKSKLDDPDKKADGGRAGFVGGGMGRRGFLKLLGGVGAGIGALKSGILGFGGKKDGTQVAKEVAKEVATSGNYPPPYFFKLVEKIKFMGDDITEKAATQNREIVKRYKDYEMTEDIGTGNIVIKKRNEGSFYDQDGIISDEYIVYKPGQADELTKGKKPPPEYDEYTVRPDSDGKLRDSEDGLDSIDEILEEVGDPDSMTLKKADGGRIGYKIGSSKKGVQSLLDLIRNKFGKESITTADKIPVPNDTLKRNMFKKFEARNPSPSRQLTDDEIDELAAEVGELDAYDFDGTVGSANRIRKEAKDYQDEMYQQYKMGKLDPEPGDKSPARKRFLQQKFDEMESSGDPKLMTRDEIEELTFFDMGTEMDSEIAKSIRMETEAEKKLKKLNMSDEEIALREDYPYDTDAQIKARLDDIDIKEGVDDVMRDTSPAGLERSLEVDDLMLKYPGINRDLAKQIANDPDPKRKADVISMIEQTFKMDEMGMSGDEIIDTFRKKTDRTKQANGGLSYLMGM